MKFLSQLFEGRGTAWTSSAFTKARTKLILLYLVIIGIVITLFAGLVVLQVNEAFTSTQIPADSRIVMTASDAEAKAKELKPDNYIDQTSYSLEDNTLLYKIIFDDDEEVEVDLLTGTVVLGDTPDETEEEEPLFDLLTDEIDEVIGWLGLLVFLGAGLGSILIAHFTLRPIAKSVEQQKQFVSDAAHELRNPLASLMTTLESYTRSDDTSRTFSKSIAEDMVIEVKRLIHLSESLLSFERNKKQITSASTSVTVVVDSVEQSLLSLLQEKSIKLKRNIASVPLPMSADDLSLVIYNLIHNAIKFSAPHTTIQISWDGRTLSVADEGSGIAQKYIPFIFDRFYKTDEARGFSDYGSGLGLALVQERVMSYGGTIQVESELGKGTTFLMTI